MARSFTVDVEGGSNTVRRINMFDMKLKQEIIDLVKTTSKEVQRVGKSKAPVSRVPKSKGKSGDLKRSIRPKYFDKGLSSTVVPRKPKGAHRHLVEYGTGQRRTRGGANRGSMPAQPFMAPAERSKDSNFNSAIRRIIDRDEVI